MVRFRYGMVLVVAVLILGGCAKVYDRSYSPFEVRREGFLLRVGMTLPAEELSADGYASATVFALVFSNRPFAQARIKAMHVGSGSNHDAFAFANRTLTAEPTLPHNKAWRFVADADMGAERIPFTDYDVEVDMDVLDEKGEILESFKVAGIIKAQTVSRPKWLPY